jgi:hypothetical protein
MSTALVPLVTTLHLGTVQACAHTLQNHQSEPICSINRVSPHLGQIMGCT